MPECDYCGASFDSEAAELKHLKSEHRDELGPIDRRRVGDVETDEEGLPWGPIALGFVVMASLGIVTYVVFFAGGGGGASGQPYDYGSAHDHGTLQAQIAGEQINFTSSEYADRDTAFHFHPNQTEPIWHTHARGVTVQYALGTLGIEVNDEGTVLTYDNTTYRDEEPGTTVNITVNGEPVEPGEYVLSGGTVQQARNGEGDDIRVVVETE